MVHVSGRPLRLAFAGIATAVVALDQLTKTWLVSVLDPGESFPVLGDLLRIVHYRNDGGLFGFLHGQAGIFALLSLVVIGGIVLYHDRSGRMPMLSVTLGLLLGGALGNLVDRVRFGSVIDFVDAGVGTFRWYTFNVADAAISTSIVLLFVLALFPRLSELGRTGAGGPDGAPDA